MIIHSSQNYGRTATNRIAQSNQHGIDGAQALVGTFYCANFSICFNSPGKRALMSSIRTMLRFSTPILLVRTIPASRNARK